MRLLPALTLPAIVGLASPARADDFSLTIKDHRYTPRNQDCVPGLGEIDHYKLLITVARTGLDMPLACENIFEPIVLRPAQAEGVDLLARRAREFLETVVRGVQSIEPGANK